MASQNVTFVTFCHWRDYQRLASGVELASRIRSHKYPFAETIVVRQRLRDVPEAGLVDFKKLGATRELESEDYPDILQEFGINPDQPKADDMTHGPTAPHYWKWHVINHLIGLKEANSPYVVFSDADCRMERQPDKSWVEYGIEILDKHPDRVLIVSPSDGGRMHEAMIGRVRLTQNISQQMFLCKRSTLSAISFDMPWDWEYTAPGGPMQEYYYMLEGRMWRWMHKNGKYRAILPVEWRYWHDGWH